MKPKTLLSLEVSNLKIHLHLIMIKSPPDPTTSTNTNNRPRRECAGQGVTRLEVGHGGVMYRGIKEAHYDFINVRTRQETKAVATMLKELKQLVDVAMEGKPVVEAVQYSTLSRLEKREAQEVVNLIQEKRDD